MTLTLSAECDSVRASFIEWNDVQTTLESQLSESLAALSAYQSHLDNWQQQLAHERGELHSEREQLHREQLELAARAAENNEQSTAFEADLLAAREKVASLSANLLERTDELRTLERQNAALSGELESSRAKERELTSALDGQKRASDSEHAQLAEELCSVRERLAGRGESSATVGTPPAPAAAANSVTPRPVAPGGGAASNGASPVMGSIMQQFSKLRQQRAVDRESQKRAR